MFFWKTGHQEPNQIYGKFHYLFIIFFWNHPLEEKVLIWCNLASYFVSLNLFSIRVYFLNNPYICEKA